MDMEAKIAKVNPMVVIKLRVATETVAAVKDDIKAGNLPGVKFSDLFRLKGFLRERKFGDLDIGLAGPVKSSDFLTRINDQYISKGVTPNCSIEQIVELGGRVTLDLHLSDLGKAVLKVAKARLTEAEAAEAKPKRARKVEAEAKPRRARKPMAEKVARVRRPRVQQAAEISSSPAQAAAETPAATPTPAHTPAAKAGHPAWANT